MTHQVAELVEVKEALEQKLQQMDGVVDLLQDEVTKNQKKILELEGKTIMRLLSITISPVDNMDIKVQ